MVLPLPVNVIVVPVAELVALDDALMTGPNVTVRPVAVTVDAVETAMIGPNSASPERLEVAEVEAMKESPLLIEET